MNDKYIVDLVTAGLLRDSSKVEIAALTLARRLKIENPGIAKKINDTITSFSLSGGVNLRSNGNAPLPVDNDSQLEMATVVPPDPFKFQAPVLSKYLKDKIQSFIDERFALSTLLDNDIKPSTSILLTGPPGTGKTMLAKYLATCLEKNLVILDLSSTISSLMGKTGANIKKVLHYAKDNGFVLLLDEFDAIAKKRDDNSDLGEIKRVVNVLLMELETWPASSIFIATSNHPELLDKAIWRRFDHVLEINLPESGEREAILEQQLENYFPKSEEKNMNFFLQISKLLEGSSAADICRYTNNVKRRIVLKNDSPHLSGIKELNFHAMDKKARGSFCITAKEILGDNITVREIAEITGLSPAGVQHHIAKTK